MIKETEIVPTIGISGPSGAGKDYLTQHVVKGLYLINPQMVTTRPSRGEGVETKICIATSEYNDLLKTGNLVGDHENKGFRYGYRVSDISAVSKNGNKVQGAIIELNPVYQGNFADDLEKRQDELGVKLVKWVVLHAKPEYLVHNMTSRQDMPKDELEKRLEMAEMIMKAGEDLADQGKVTLFEVGWENRETMGEDFKQLLAEALETTSVK